ncbi:MAG: sulfatase [Deltaproteobacteria bacterium]|jgi:arylsulfatase A-like enzyme|nr:sulfatase [Deltaproteobacteria bacterium]
MSRNTPYPSFRNPASRSEGRLGARDTFGGQGVLSVAMEWPLSSVGRGALAALVGGIGLAGGCAPEPGDSRPSILLVVIDTLRADAVSAYGAVEGTTPAFDALASEGLLYGRAFAPSPWTLPSHASLMTGLEVDRHGVGVGGQMGLRAEFATLAERLLAAGYQTAGFSENPLVSDLFGFAQGFERFAAVTVDDVIEEDERPGSLQFDIVEEVAAFAAGRDRERPFFIFVNLFDPHSPYRDRGQNRFIGRGVSIGDTWTADALKASPNRICDRLPPPEDLKQLHGLYLGDVAAADAKLGKIAAIAREAAEGGLVSVATADHGEHFGEHRLLDHEFSVRAPVLSIPLAVHGLPGVRADRIEAPVTLVDVAASVLRWAGAEIPSEFAGRPLPIRKSEVDRSGVDLLAVYSDERLSVPEDWSEDLAPAEAARDTKRSGCWPSDRVFGDMAALTRWPFKLIWFENYPAELYDLSWDPLERSDLAELRPEVRGPLVEEAQHRVEELGLARAAGAVELPSEAELEALRELGYRE